MYTKGPWKVVGGTVIMESGGNEHVIGSTIESLTRFEETRANARLISTAPELLEICEEINQWCGTDDGAHALPFEPPWYGKLYTAIAKAKGE